MNTSQGDTSTNPLREAITKLVTDMTVEKSLSEEFLIDAIMELLTAKTTEARIDELKRLSLPYKAVLEIENRKKQLKEGLEMALTKEEWLEIPAGLRPMKRNGYPDYIGSTAS